MEQFALLQQADWEAKRRHQHDRSTLVNMYDTVSKQVVEVKQQLEGALSSRNSTDELLRQVLGAVEKLQEAQQRLDSRTAEAVQHAMAAAASAEAVQQQVDSRTAEAVQHAKAAAASAAAVQRQQGALADEIKVRSMCCPTIPLNHAPSLGLEITGAYCTAYAVPGSVCAPTLLSAVAGLGR